MASMSKRVSRSEKLLSLVGKYFKGSSRLLNLGSGDGRLSEALRNHPEGQPVKVVDVDLFDRSTTDRAPILYNGKEIPFGDRFFDATLGMYALNQAHDPDQLIAEMKRVTRGHIVIIEDLADTLWDALVCVYHGIRYNVWNFKRIRSSFTKQPDWAEICAAHGLTLVDSMHLPRFSRLTGRTYPVSRTMLVFKV